MVRLRTCDTTEILVWFTNVGWLGKCRVTMIITPDGDIYCEEIARHSPGLAYIGLHVALARWSSVLGVSAI